MLENLVRDEYTILSIGQNNKINSHLTRGPVTPSCGSDCRSEGPADTGRV